MAPETEVEKRLRVLDSHVAVLTHQINALTNAIAGEGGLQAAIAKIEAIVPMVKENAWWVARLKVASWSILVLGVVGGLVKIFWSTLNGGL